MSEVNRIWIHKSFISKSKTKSIIEIDENFLETYPCIHKVPINGIDQGEWDAIKIYEWFLSRDLSVPNHFKYAKEYLKTNNRC